jgi:hypothetical protein
MYLKGLDLHFLESVNTGPTGVRKINGPVAQHGHVAFSNAKEHTTDNRGVENPDTSSRQSSNLSGPTKTLAEIHAHLLECCFKGLIWRSIESWRVVVL